VGGRAIWLPVVIALTIVASVVGDETSNSVTIPGSDSTEATDLLEAIAVDATIVRCMLVPAVMVLMRNGNWWFPRWLDRVLPRIEIESGESFSGPPTTASSTPRGPSKS
jgi:hypothetical protein